MAQVQINQISPQPNKIFLVCPGRDELEQAFAALPRHGVIAVTTAFAQLGATLQDLEAVGFFGLQISTTKKFLEGVSLQGIKGKDGPCFDGGKTASYTGAALAALDDDHHFLMKIANYVCEKTAQNLSLPAYRKYVEISAGDLNLIDRLATDPAPFDCDTLTSDLAKIAAAIVTPAGQQPEQLLTVIYRGPFKLLVLQTGEIIRRGIPVQINSGAAEALLENGELSRCAIDTAGFAAPVAQNFKAQLVAHGNGFIFDRFEPDIGQQFYTGNLPALRQAPLSMQQRLLKLIETGTAYFVLTGSDTRNEQGCCPSNAVTAANRLVEAGILQVARNIAAPDSCPVNFYAFAGEIRVNAGRPEFSRNPEIRTAVADYLHELAGKKRSFRFVIPALRWILLAFVALSVIFLFRQPGAEKQDAFPGLASRAFYQTLELQPQTKLLVVLFHRTQRCAFCLNMESWTQQALQENFSAEMATSEIGFRSLDMESPQYRSIAGQLDLFTATIVVAATGENEPVRWKIFTEAWYETDAAADFSRKFVKFVEDFRAKK